MGAILTALYLGAAPAPASPAPGQAKVVELYVVVTEDGRRLTDLAREDFEVFETGQRQRITRFVPEFGKANDQERGRRIVFVVDDNHMEPDELAPVKVALHQFFESSLLPADEAAVVLAGRRTSAPPPMGCFDLPLRGHKQEALQCRHLLARARRRGRGSDSGSERPR